MQRSQGDNSQASMPMAERAQVSGMMNSIAISSNRKEAACFMDGGCF